MSLMTMVKVGKQQVPLHRAWMLAHSEVLKSSAQEYRGYYEFDYHAIARLQRAVIVYKAARRAPDTPLRYIDIADKVIIRLRLLAGTRVHWCSAQAGSDGHFYPLSDSAKMRAEKAEVVSMKNAFTQRAVTRAWSMYDGHFVYRRGPIAPSVRFSENLTICASGIHFFATEDEAREFHL